MQAKEPRSTDRIWADRQTDKHPNALPLDSSAGGRVRKVNCTYFLRDEGIGSQFAGDVFP